MRKFSFLLLLAALSCTAVAQTNKFLGRWDLTVKSADKEYPSWLELSVKEGEHLVVLERDGDEWWKCRNSEGTEGVVPASYLEVCWYLRYIFLPDFWTLDDLDEVYKAGGIQRLSCRLRYSLC